MLPIRSLWERYFEFFLLNHCTAYIKHVRTLGVHVMISSWPFARYNRTLVYEATVNARATAKEENEKKQKPSRNAILLPSPGNISAHAPRTNQSPSINPVAVASIMTPDALLYSTTWSGPGPVEQSEEQHVTDT